MNKENVIKAYSDLAAKEGPIVPTYFRPELVNAATEKSRRKLKKLINDMYGIVSDDSNSQETKDAAQVVVMSILGGYSNYDVSNLYQCAICGAKFGEKHKRGWE